LIATAGLAAEFGVAALAFVGTNIDNTLVTMAMVAGAPVERARRIATGQVVGFWIMVGVAAGAAAVLYEFSPATVGLLGLVPLAIGLKGLFVWASGRSGGRSPSGAGAVERRAVGRSLTAAALVTMATSGDNLAVYIPLFRAASAGDVAALVIVFAVGEVLVTWLILTGGRHPRARAVMTRLGGVAVPVLLCCIGVLVMLQAGTFSAL
jgi:cadmium resistance protein CadD (predicted permease)